MRARLMLRSVYCHKTPYRLVVEVRPHCDILCATSTCPSRLGLLGKWKCIHVGGVLFALEDFIRRHLQQQPEPLSCTSIMSFCLGCPTKSKHRSQVEPKRIQVQFFGIESSRRGMAWQISFKEWCLNTFQVSWFFFYFFYLILLSIIWNTASQLWYKSDWERVQFSKTRVTAPSHKK